MQRTIRRMYRGETPRGIFHNLNVDEPVPYYLVIHAWLFVIDVTFGKRGMDHITTVGERGVW